MSTIDVIIPTYRPDETFLRLLDALKTQTMRPAKVIVMNTGRSLWGRQFPDIDFKERYPEVKLYHISPGDFDHGGTRREGVLKSDADCFLMMTQDAVPANRKLIEELYRALTDDERAYAAYARQLPREGASFEEAFERTFNYPATSATQTRKDVKTRGFKAYYCSNVCALYRRTFYDELGGFATRAIFNEDVYLAQTAIHAGYHIVYAASAQVVHSHGYTCMEQLHRNFDQGVSQAMRAEIFAQVPQEQEGLRLVKACTKAMIAGGKWFRLPYFYLKCAFRLAGYRLGKSYRKLPVAVCRRLSMNQAFFGGVQTPEG